MERPWFSVLIMFKMEKRIQRQGSNLQFNKNVPGCFWTIFHTVDHHRWHNVKKMLPYKKHSRSKFGHLPKNSNLLFLNFVLSPKFMLGITSYVFSLSDIFIHWSYKSQFHFISFIILLLLLLLCSL